MKKAFARLCLLCMNLLLLSACNDNDNNNGTAQIRVLHASPDAPAVNILLNGQTALENINYGAGSALIDVDAGDNSIQVDGILPNGTTNVIGPTTLNLQADMRYDIMAVNNTSEIEALVLDAPIAQGHLISN